MPDLSSATPRPRSFSHLPAGFFEGVGPKISPVIQSGFLELPYERCWERLWPLGPATSRPGGRTVDTPIIVSNQSIGLVAVNAQIRADSGRSGEYCVNPFNLARIDDVFSMMSL